MWSFVGLRINSMDSIEKSLHGVHPRARTTGVCLITAILIQWAIPQNDRQRARVQVRGADGLLGGGDLEVDRGACCRDVFTVWLKLCLQLVDVYGPGVAVHHSSPILGGRGTKENGRKRNMGIYMRTRAPGHVFCKY